MLSPKQKETLDFINKYQLQNGHGPTLEEIATSFGRSIPTIHQHVEALRQKGYLKLPSSNARTIGVFDPNEEVAQIPLLNYISAGGGLENLENPQPLKVQRSLLSSSGQHYGLIVRGDSMIEDGILPDDIVIIRHQNFADNGNAVIALIEEDGNQLATIKRYYNHGSKIELRPRNPKLNSKFYEPGTIEIRGKFIGLLRHEL